VITGLIKANFPARISFAVTSQVDSRVVLDMPGAEKLLGRGDMLYMASDSSSPVRLQGVWVSEKELDYLINFWRNAAPPPSGVPAPDITQAITLSEESELLPSDEDPMLDEAKRVVQQAGHASVSLLQRKLRIGYARAGHLIDVLEQQGFIGPPVDGGRSRDVYGEPDNDAPPAAPGPGRAQ
jgi:S-DNA-T family DNA segregation ATPase FtsK/SpoIIIE